MPPTRGTPLPTQSAHPLVPPQRLTRAYTYFTQGSLWSFNYFFYNKKLKRILFFTCAAMSKAAIEDDMANDDDLGDDDFADTMDI